MKENMMGESAKCKWSHADSLLSLKSTVCLKTESEYNHMGT